MPSVFNTDVVPKIVAAIAKIQAGVDISELENAIEEEDHLVAKSSS